MSGGRTTIQAWELPKLRAIMEGQTREERVEALRGYVLERDRRSRYAKVRNRRDRERRTLVGTHVPREQAEYIRWLANMEGTSVTQFVNLAIRLAIERSDTYRGE